jgi:hypothetical protein
MEHEEHVSAEELEDAEGEALPDREAMSIVPLPTDPLPAVLVDAGPPDHETPPVEPKD